MKRRRIYDLGTFHREAAGQGFTYAQAQIRETCGMVGPVRRPAQEDPEDPVYRKVSVWNRLRKLAGSR